MSKAVISGTGPDQPGIVAAISSILLKYGCNIEDSTMTRLAREFAVILIINVPDEADFSALQRDMEALDKTHQLSIMVKPIPENLALDSHVPENPYMLSVAGQDQAGITYQVSRKLAELAVNITDLNAQIIQGEDGPIYIMMVEVDVPGTVSVETAGRELQTLGRELGVEIQLRPLEAVAL